MNEGVFDVRSPILTKTRKGKDVKTEIRMPKLGKPAAGQESNFKTIPQLSWGSVALFNQNN